MPCGLKTQGNPRVAPDGWRMHHFEPGFIDLEVRKVAQHLLHSDTNFETRQSGAQAGMQPGPEPQMIHGIPPYIEDIRVWIMALIAVRGHKDDPDFFTGLENLT